MSFSSLPPELVRQIIESTVPHTFHIMAYKERQSTLCSLSLVSELFRSIAQPLLFEIVRLKRVGDAEKLPTAHALGENTRSRVKPRWLVVNRMEYEYGSRTQEENDRFLESLRIFGSMRYLTVDLVETRTFIELLSMASPHLTYLQICGDHFEVPEAIHLPNLRNLTLFDVSSKLFIALVDPATVPNLRNFAFVDPLYTSVTALSASRIDLLLPNLDTLTLAARIWLDPLAAFLRSAASRTLVDFASDVTPRLSSSTASLVHARLHRSSLDSSLFSHAELQYHLDLWSTLIQNNSSLSLESIYLDSSLQPLGVLPSATKLCLDTLNRVCQERQIDLVFDRSPVFHPLDPHISEEFVRRQKDKRGRESAAGSASRG